MQMTITLRLKHEADEPNYTAAKVLVELAYQLCADAPHDFITTSVETFDAVARSEWWANGPTLNAEKTP